MLLPTRSWSMFEKTIWLLNIFKGQSEFKAIFFVSKKDAFDLFNTRKNMKIFIMNNSK